MGEITEVTSSVAEMMKDVLSAMPRAFARGLGLNVETVSTSHLQDRFEITFRFTVPNYQGTVAPLNWAHKARQIGLPNLPWNFTFMTSMNRGALQEVTVVDIKTRNRRYPIIIRDSTGKQWKVTKGKLSHPLRNAGLL